MSSSPLDSIRKDAANGDGLPRCRFIQEVLWEKRPNPGGEIAPIPSLLITFRDSCAPTPSIVDAPKATLSQRFALYNPQGPSQILNESSYPS
jgi:hypothetical protein